MISEEELTQAVELLGPDRVELFKLKAMQALLGLIIILSIGGTFSYGCIQAIKIWEGLAYP